MEHSWTFGSRCRNYPSVSNSGCIARCTRLCEPRRNGDSLIRRRYPRWSSTRMSRAFQRGETEHLTGPSPQRAALRLSGARVLRRGTERCWTCLITTGRPRILEPAGFIINPRLQCRPAPSCPPFHLLWSATARLPPLLLLLLFPTSESRQHEIPA